MKLLDCLASHADWWTYFHAYISALRFLAVSFFWRPPFRWPLVDWNQKSLPWALFCVLHHQACVYTGPWQWPYSNIVHHQYTRTSPKSRKKDGDTREASENSYKRETTAESLYFCLRKHFFFGSRKPAGSFRAGRKLCFLNVRFLTSFGRLPFCAALLCGFTCFWRPPARSFWRPWVDGNQKRLPLKEKCIIIQLFKLCDS